MSTETIDGLLSTGGGVLATVWCVLAGIGLLYLMRNGGK